MAKNQRVVMIKVLNRIRPYWPALAGSLVLATLQVSMTLYIPILVGNAIDCIIETGLVDFVTMGQYLRQVLLCTAVAALAQWMMSEINNFVTFRVTRNIRNEAFSHIQNLPLSYLDSHPREIWSAG